MSAYEMCSTEQAYATFKHTPVALSITRGWWHGNTPACEPRTCAHVEDLGRHLDKRIPHRLCARGRHMGDVSNDRWACSSVAAVITLACEPYVGIASMCHDVRPHVRGPHLGRRWRSWPGTGPRQVGLWLKCRMPCGMWIVWPARTWRFTSTLPCAVFSSTMPNTCGGNEVR